MNDLEIKLFTKARETIPGRFLMANMVSRRLEQLIRGAEPKLDPEECKRMSNLEIALKEVSEKKITLVAKETEE